MDNRKAARVVAALLLCSGWIANGAEVDVYLIGGQSNADGRAPTNGLTGRLAGWAGEQTNAPAYFANLWPRRFLRQIGPTATRYRPGTIA